MMGGPCERRGIMRDFEWSVKPEDRSSLRPLAARTLGVPEVRALDLLLV